MCAWIWFSEIKYSQLKINHLNNTSSTKAVGDGLLLRQSEGDLSGVFNKDVKVPLHEAELVGTSSSNSNTNSAERNPNAQCDIHAEKYGLCVYFDTLMLPRVAHTFTKNIACV